MRLPRSNKGAAIGSVLAGLGMLLLQALVQFGLSGQPFPTTRDDWFRFVIAILGAMFLAPQSPRFSWTELVQGYRTVNPPPEGQDAPVVTETKAHEMERESLKREALDA